MNRPAFDQVNLVVRDMDAALAFYRMLGAEVPNEGFEWPAGSGAMHCEAEFSNGMELAFDNEPMAKIWHGGWRERGTGGRAVIGMTLPSREAVDERYEALVNAGYRGVQPPYDAFWGSRYAIVADPDGNDVGLMSPVDAARKYVPKV